MIVAEVRFERAMILVPPGDVEGVWSFILEPASDHTTRFVMLSLAAKPRIADRIFWEPAHFVMERKMMPHATDAARALLARSAEWTIRNSPTFSMVRTPTSSLSRSTGKAGQPEAFRR